MPKKVEAREKVRESVLAKATLDDLREFDDYLAGKWKETFMPRVVRLWEVSADEECERIAFNGPLLNVRSLAGALEREKGFRAARDAAGGSERVLIFYPGVEGDHPRKAAGVATTDSVEISTRVPASARKKLFYMLPRHLVT